MQDASSDVTIAVEDPGQPEVRAFFAASEAYMTALYPVESNHFFDVATLRKPSVRFLVARRDGTALGCGAIVRATDDTAEIKRMWVDPGVRRGQVGKKLLAALIGDARAAGIKALQLETGISQPEAIALYRGAGFVVRDPFAGYAADPWSLFMELRFAD